RSRASRQLRAEDSTACCGKRSPRRRRSVEPCAGKIGDARVLANRQEASAETLASNRSDRSLQPIACDRDRPARACDVADGVEAFGVHQPREVVTTGETGRFVEADRLLRERQCFRCAACRQQDEGERRERRCALPGGTVGGGASCMGFRSLEVAERREDSREPDVRVRALTCASQTFERCRGADLDVSRLVETVEGHEHAAERGVRVRDVCGESHPLTDHTNFVQVRTRSVEVAEGHSLNRNVQTRLARRARVVRQLELRERGLVPFQRGRFASLGPREEAERRKDAPSHGRRRRRVVRGGRLDGREELSRGFAVTGLDEADRGATRSDEKWRRRRGPTKRDADPLREIADAAEVAESELVADGDVDRAPGFRAAARQELHRFRGARKALDAFAAPRERFGLKQAERAEVVALRATEHASLGVRLRGVEIVADERAFRGERIPPNRACRRRSAFEVLGDAARFHLFGLRFEPASGGGVHRRSLRLRDAPVCRVTQEVVPELVLGFASDRGDSPPVDELPLGESHEDAIDVLRVHRVAEEGAHAAAPEPATEDTRRAQQASLVDVEGVDARFQHRHHCGGPTRRTALDDRAQDLFEEERVAFGLRHDAKDGRGVVDVGEDVAHESFARALRQRREMDFRTAVRRPEAGKPLGDFGARQGEHEERNVGELAERRLDEFHAGGIAPMEIFKDEEHRFGATLRGEPIFPGPVHPIAAHRRIDARLLVARTRGEPALRGEDLEEMLRDARAVSVGDDPREALDPLSTCGRRSALDDSRGVSNHSRDQAER
ncbi:MAG TPA: hypothetical protein VIF62_20905, partial [Labilithrix sp.]